MNKRLKKKTRRKYFHLFQFLMENEKQQSKVFKKTKQQETIGHIKKINLFPSC